ncbi:MotA/TolQ/ExbB proton channel family protein [Hellea balneolensis]|uniref:MotA/TolQ/ExbB proton channel family protein n=1 Tax=Hellea balneolensis TaxID=287478 RepID=UPI0003F5690D|nr:MotA/TolQ/ExbB proton channel family protein [Hellea balneolensis]
MKFFTKSTAAFVGAAVLLSAAPASAQINSISDLLNQVRSDSAKTEAENRDREAKFRQRANEQTAMLGEARRELAQLERKAASVQSTFDANGNTIARLEGELRAAQGDFGEVFGLARSKAGEFKAILDSSLITAQYPQRTQVLGTVAESKALPDSAQLNAIWQTMLQEIKAQRQVATFTAPVANVDDGAEQSVTRVGPFSIFTEQSADFLQYTPPAGEEANVLLAKLPRQPGGAISSAASDVANSSGGIVYAPIDPTRGELLKSFERVPDTGERIAQGGTIGKIILILLAIGVIFGVLNIIRLALAKMAVGGQKRKAQPSKSNALGRIMMAYEGAKNKDADTVELKLDEAILRESPKFEFGLNFLKLAAGIAPLLGLLGTVTGMIKTFQAMMIYGTGDPQLMAGGISEALVTTMLGLIAAIPLLILHSFCSSLARSIQGTLEEQSAGIVARHVESRGV